MKYLKKNWLVILIGCLSAVLGVLTLLTAVKLKRATPLAPTVPQKKPKAATPACILTFKLKPPAPPPTETPSPTPKEASPTAFLTEKSSLATPTATPTSRPNKPPFCLSLSASPVRGSVPLRVTFNGKGEDEDGKIIAFEFSFGDGKVKIVEKDVKGTASHSLDYTYSTPGVYWALLRVKDDSNTWSTTPKDCKVKIEVQEKVVGGAESWTSKESTSSPTASPTATLALKTPPATSTSIPVPKVPQAGVALPTILAIFSGFLLVLLGVLF